MIVCFFFTGVDPKQEAVIEYNKNRQPAVLPPDIYMGLRFADTAQPSSDVTGQQVGLQRSLMMLGLLSEGL